MALSESKKTNHLITFFVTGSIILLTILFIYWMRFASAEGGYDYIKKWGSRGTGNSQFNYPGGIAVDNSGYLYVVDSGNDRIQKFDTNGIYNYKWGSYGTGNTQFFYPEDVAVDSSGNVYVTDSENLYVKKYNSNGVFERKWPGTGSTSYKDYYPLGIAVDGNDNVFVVYLIDDWNAETLKYGVQKFNSSGVYERQKISSTSPTAGSFNFPQGIEVDGSGNVYVVDSGNNRIQKFTNNLTYANIKWGSAGTLNGQFRWPTDVSIDSDGNIYVTDTANNRVQKFDSSGKFITKWGVTGIAIGRFSYPEGIAVDTNGNVYVVDSGNNRIQKFTFKPMTINNGNYFTKSPVVTLKFNTASFSVTNAVNVKVKNSTSALETTPTEAFSTTKSWTLSFDTGNGTKTVYAQLEDEASTILDTISDTIILDTTKPSASFYPYPSKLAKGKYVKLYYKVADTLSPQVYIKLKVINPKGTTVLNKSLGAKSKTSNYLYYSYKTPLVTGYYRYQVILTDFAGNIFTSTKKVIRVTN